MSSKRQRLGNLMNHVRRTEPRAVPDTAVLGGFTYDSVAPNVWRVMFKSNMLDQHEVCVATCTGPDCKKRAGDMAVKLNEFLQSRF